MPRADLNDINRLSRGRARRQLYQRRRQAGHVRIPTKPPVCNGMIAPKDSWMMPPPLVGALRYRD